MSAATIATILLAAGAASRYGSPKQLLGIEGVPMVRRAALAAIAAGTRVVVVTGAHRIQVEACLHGLELACVFNASWRGGIGGSIAKGIGVVRRAMPTASACIVMLADQPEVTALDLRRFVRAANAAPRRIVSASYAGISGPPCLFPREYFEELAALTGDRGARMLTRRHADCVDELPIPHAALDIDTVADYSRYARTPAAASPNGVPQRERIAGNTRKP